MDKNYLMITMITKTSTMKNNNNKNKIKKIKKILKPYLDLYIIQKFLKRNILWV